jgi:hypothetical protein
LSLYFILRTFEFNLARRQWAAFHLAATDLISIIRTCSTSN